jgi:hypothetical protein
MSRFEMGRRARPFFTGLMRAGLSALLLGCAIVVAGSLPVRADATCDTARTEAVRTCRAGQYPMRCQLREGLAGLSFDRTACFEAECNGRGNTAKDACERRAGIASRCAAVERDAIQRCRMTASVSCTESEGPNARNRCLQEADRSQSEEQNRLRESLRERLRQGGEGERRRAATERLSRLAETVVYTCEADGPYCWVIGARGVGDLACGRMDKAANLAASRWLFSQAELYAFDSCPSYLKDAFHRQDTGAIPNFRVAAAPARVPTKGKAPAKDKDRTRRDRDTPSTITGTGNDDELAALARRDLTPTFDLHEGFYPDGSRCINERISDCQNRDYDESFTQTNLAPDIYGPPLPPLDDVWWGSRRANPSRPMPSSPTAVQPNGTSTITGRTPTPSGPSTITGRTPTPSSPSTTQPGTPTPSNPSTTQPNRPSTLTERSPGPGGIKIDPSSQGSTGDLNSLRNDVLKQVPRPGS